jgi:hypothetical protein
MKYASPRILTVLKRVNDSVNNPRVTHKPRLGGKNVALLSDIHLHSKCVRIRGSPTCVAEHHSTTPKFPVNT